MSTPTSAANQTPAATPKDPAAVLAEDKARRGQIRASFQGFASREGVFALQLECEDDHACTPEAAGLKLLAVLGKDASSVNGGRPNSRVTSRHLNQ